MSPAPSVITNNSSLVTLSILVEGRVIPGQYAVVSAVVRRDVNKIGTAKIKIEDGSFSGLKDDFPAANSGLFDHGKKVTVKAGYNSIEDIIFEGVIVKQGIKLSNDSTLLTIEIKEEAVKMSLSRNSVVYSEKKDSEIISELIKKSALTATVDATTVNHSELVQYYCSDWDFMLMRADLNGMVVITEGKEVKVEKPKIDGDAVVSVENGKSMYSINAEIDSRYQYKSVASVAWDMTNQKIVKSSSKPVDDQAIGIDSSKLSKVFNIKEYNLQTPSNLPVSLIEAWATGKMTRSKLAKIVGSVKFIGSAKVIPGVLIELVGFNKNFNGKVYVSGVEHVLEGGDWVTEVFMGMPFNSYSEEMPDIMAPSTSGMLSGIQGLHTAVVKKIHDDKDGQHRIQITYPTLQQDNLGVWARLATFYATKDSGAFFIPEVGDEVVVGFINEDPHQPVILGSLYSSKNTPPLTSEEKNKFKSLVTKSKMKITFDEEKKIITVETPGKNSIVLDDDKKAITVTDSNNNKVELNDKGMTFTCAKDFTVKAQGKIIMEAQGDIQGKATGAYKMEGMSVEAKGQTKFAAEGAQVEVKGSAQTTIKGGMVMIN